MHWQAVETTPIRIGAPVLPARADAIREALLKRAVPLSRLDQGRLEPLATAGLVRDGDRVGLVTAAHIFERALGAISPCHCRATRALHGCIRHAFAW